MLDFLNSSFVSSHTSIPPPPLFLTAYFLWHMQLKLSEYAEYVQAGKAEVSCETIGCWEVC